MKLGIMGLPLAGKTTVFNALTGAHGSTGGYSADANAATVDVPDERLDRLAEMFPPKKVTRAHIEYVDIPGVSATDRRDHIVSVFAALREVDALLQVVRHFEDEAAPHPRGSLDPARDIREIWEELVIADLDVAERRIKKLRTQVTKPTPTQEHDRKELAVLEQCAAALEAGEGVRGLNLSESDSLMIRAYQFLTEKPMITVLNVEEDRVNSEEVRVLAEELGPGTLIMSAKIEAEITELEEDERQEFLRDLGIEKPAASRLVQECYRLLKLRSFFTGLGEDCRAWTIHGGDTAHTAAGKIHKDMQRGFIRAEVMHYEDLIELGSEKAARAAGRARLEGKDYVVQDGDIILFRFKV
jgi:GTP-binding protein YchF